jgi:hypothetical protein
MPRAAFEPATPATNRPQTYTIDRAATEIGIGLYIYIYIYIRSRVSSGSIVSGYGLDDRAIGVRSPEGAKDFSSILCVQTGSEAHPASCPMGTEGPFPGGKSAAGA